MVAPFEFWLEEHFDYPDFLPWNQILEFPSSTGVT
jgi:hypothetical protein